MMADHDGFLETIRKYTAIEISLPIIVTVGTLYFQPAESKLLSVILGLLVALVLVWHKTKSLLEDQALAQQGLTRLISSLLRTDHELLVLALRFWGQTISASEMTQVWCDLCWIFEMSYDATNYIRPESIYNESWASPAIAIQVAKTLARHAKVRKIFLVESESELKPVQQNLNRQVDARIGVYHSIYKNISTNVALDALSKELESTDFGIFDGRCVLVWKLDSNRTITGGELIFDRRKIEQYQTFFNRLVDASTVYKPMTS